jgi:hypothetical protein
MTAADFWTLGFSGALSLVVSLITVRVGLHGAETRHARADVRNVVESYASTIRYVRGGRARAPIDYVGFRSQSDFTAAVLKPAQSLGGVEREALRCYLLLLVGHTMLKSETPLVGVDVTVIDTEREKSRLFEDQLRIHARPGQPKPRRDRWAILVRLMNDQSSRSISREALLLLWLMRAAVRA